MKLYRLYSSQKCWIFCIVPFPHVSWQCLFISYEGDNPLHVSKFYYNTHLVHNHSKSFDKALPSTLTMIWMVTQPLISFYLKLARSFLYQFISHNFYFAHYPIIWFELFLYSATQSYFYLTFIHHISVFESYLGTILYIHRMIMIETIYVA